VEIGYEAGRGVVSVRVPPDARLLPPLPGKAADLLKELPREPDDYDDPEQLAAYEARLGEYFHSR
jgi:hypothetical protein